MSLWNSRKRKNAAEQEERAWNQNRPADYVNQQKDAMDAVTGQVGSGFDWNTGSEAYQQYRKLNAANAQGAAENAKANAALLSGGYGSSYADSVAQQGQRETMAGIDNALPSLRGQALTEYQNKQNSLLNALSGMASTEALDRSAYGANLSNYDAWKNFLANQTAQARTEYANDKTNAWNWLKNIGSAVLGAYDTYKGFSQQKWQNDFAERQYNDSLARANKSDALSAYEQAFQLYQQGAGDAAQNVLNTYGLDANAFANYTGAPVTRADQASALNAAASLVAAGNNEAAANLLKMYGLDADAAGSYSTIANRQLATALAKSAATKSSSSGSGRSRSSGSTSKSSGWTNSQLRSIASDFSKMDESEPLYNHYKQVLTEAGWLDADTGTSTTNRGQSDRSNYAALLAKNYAKKGYSPWAIMNNMHENGYTDDEIAQALENAGVKY